MIEAENYQRLDIDRRDNGVVVVRLNRPEKLNAVDARMHRELANITRDADHDEAVKVLVFHGAGRSFCAGGDFSADSDVVGSGRSSRRETLEIVDHLLSCSIPVIAAVHGHALGLGATFALLADIVVAGTSARFGDPHVRMGVGAGDGGQVIWPLLIGVNRAKYFLMTGEQMAAEEALQAGLVNFVVDDQAGPGAVLERALEIADGLAAGPGQAISASKMGINQYIRLVSNLVLPYSFALEVQTFGSRDAGEAARAFQEKRPPRFEGR